MEKDIQSKFLNNQKNYNYLKVNSHWIKYLNRDSISYKEFITTMKNLYKQNPLDKVSNVMDNIDLVSNVLNVLK